MSTSLVWFLKPKSRDLPDGLKYVLSNRYSLDKERQFDSSDLGYLEGLRDAGVDGADKLIELIIKHDIVFVKLEY